MYELKGPVRHFFNKDYALALLADAGLSVKSIETGEERIYDRQSAFIKVAASKLVN